MKSKIFIWILILNLIPVLPIWAQERTFKGEIAATGMLRKLGGEKAKFNEYRDIRDGVYIGIDTGYETDGYYLDLKAADLGYKTQRYDLAGGRWGSFKYYFSYDELPHNLTENAKTFYSGVGGAYLNYSTQPPSTNISTWNTFDYSIETKKYGGGFKFEMLKPFFFNVSLFKEEKKGIYPLGGAAGSSPIQGAIELPIPINYTTDTITLEAGYFKEPLSFSISYLYSKFINDNNVLYFRNPISAITPDYLTLPPESTDYKLEFKGAVKLPWNSKFHMHFSQGSTKSKADLLNYYVLPTSLVTIQMADNVFNGQRDRQIYDLIFTSRPVFFLDAKLFYKYYNTNNKSDRVETIDGPSIYSNYLFDYQKIRYGAELGFKLPAGFYLTLPYTHVQTKRTVREDIPKNDDNIYGVELKWSGLEFMVSKVGYERLERKGEFEGPHHTSPTDSANIEQYQRRFDVAPKDQDTYKVTFDFFPIEGLNITLGYKFKDTNYKETILGLRSAKRNQFNLDLDYFFWKRVRLFGYLDYEYAKLEQMERNFPFNVANVFDPATPPTARAYNWTVSQTENNFAYGLGAEIQLLPEKLALNLQHNYYKSNGHADYSYLLGLLPLPGGRSQDNIDISNWGNYETRNYSVKLTYNASKSFSFSLGYIYEKFISDDAQYNGYLYYYPTGGATYLTGAYRDLSFEANIIFLTTSFRF